MPAPALLAPVALKAAGWTLAGAAALAVVAFARAADRPRPEAEEELLDAQPEGMDLAASRDAGRARADLRGRLRRSVRLGAGGPGFEFDLSAMARLRLASLPPVRRRAP